MILLIGLLLSATPSGAVAQISGSCPSGNQSALHRVHSFLAEPAWAGERQDLGISVGADRARVLSDAQDPEVCQSLSEKFPDPDEQNRSFYKAGSYYFVIYEWEAQPDGTTNIGGAGFIVLGENLEALRFYVK